MKPRVESLDLNPVWEDKFLQSLLDILYEHPDVYWRDVKWDFINNFIETDCIVRNVYNGGRILKDYMCGVVVKGYVIADAEYSKNLIHIKGGGYYSFMFFYNNIAIFKKDKYNREIPVKIFKREKI